MMMNHLTSYCYFRLHPGRAIPLKKLHKNCPRYVDSVFSSGTFKEALKPSLPKKSDQSLVSPMYPMIPLYRLPWQLWAVFIIWIG